MMVAGRVKDICIGLEDSALAECLPFQFQTRRADLKFVCQEAARMGDARATEH